jgi:hypothetical protein
LPQGSPLSALLFLLFADDLLDCPANTGYIDDIARLETSPTLEENVAKLEAHMEEVALRKADDGFDGFASLRILPTITCHGEAEVLPE